MSSSLNVVSMAQVFWASFSVLAIFCLIRFILTLCSDLVPAISLVGSAGGTRTIGAGPVACAAAGEGAGLGAGGGTDAEGPVGVGGVGGGVVGMGPPAAETELWSIC